jgi:hypothetical protein
MASAYSFGITAQPAPWVSELRHVHGKKPIRVWPVARLAYAAIVATLVVTTLLAAAGIVG